jgi:hypothetical protein
MVALTETMSKETAEATVRAMFPEMVNWYMAERDKGVKSKYQTRSKLPNRIQGSKSKVNRGVTNIA